MREQERGEGERQETPSEERSNGQDLTERGKRQQKSVFFSSDRRDMAENNTNLFLEILPSFDAGELFLTSLLFSPFHLFSCGCYDLHCLGAN